MSEPAAAALELFEEKTAARKEALNQYDEAPDISKSDEELESECPQIDHFLKKTETKQSSKLNNFSLV